MSQPQWQGSAADYLASQNPSQPQALPSSPGTPQPPVGRPQAPPVVPPPPGGQPPTLADAQQRSGGDNMVDQYAQALALTRAAIAPAKMPYQQAPEHVSLFHNILSWGGAGAMAGHQQYQHNMAVDAYN